MNLRIGRLVLMALLAGGLMTARPDGARAADAGSEGPGAWRLDATAYVWLQGVNGNVTALGHQVDIDASPSDLLSYADFPLQGVIHAQYRRLVAIADGSWTPLTVNKSSSSVLPLPPGIAIQVKYSPVIASAEVGYRVADVRGYSVDGLAGARYWHLGTKITLTPSPSGGSVNNSTDWVDPVVGARIEKTIVPKLRATALGDVGGWGAGSQLDYQFVGALALSVTPRLMLDAAWRQMYADYEKDPFHSKITQSGLVAGLTLKIM